jgi:hypothetical protein
MNVLTPVAFTAASVVLAFVCNRYDYDQRNGRKASALLQEWASSNGLRILQVRRNFWLPPRPLAWWLGTKQSQTIFHVSVYEDSSHLTRSAWLRMDATMPYQSASKPIEVKWVDAG